MDFPQKIMFCFWWGLRQLRFVLHVIHFPIFLFFFFFWDFSRFFWRLSSDQKHKYTHGPRLLLLIWMITVIIYHYMCYLTSWAYYYYKCSLILLTHTKTFQFPNLACSSFGQNLQTSHYFWENFFAVLISIFGLLLFSYFIGNLQVRVLLLFPLLLLCVCIWIS